MKSMGLVFSALMSGVLLSGCGDSFGSVDDYATGEAVSVREIADGVFIIAPIKEPSSRANTAARNATTRKLKRWLEESGYNVLSVCPSGYRWPYFCVTVQKPPQLPPEKE